MNGEALLANSRRLEEVEADLVRAEDVEAQRQRSGLFELPTGSSGDRNPTVICAASFAGSAIKPLEYLVGRFIPRGKPF